MEAETDAIRAALVTLDTLSGQLDDANMFGEDVLRPLNRMRRLLTEQLRVNESILWTLAGLPEMPRALDTRRPPVVA